jgi:probable O-glycosylation ligase (exosortase A-associated)
LSIREAILIVIIVFGSLAALIRPKIGLYIYTWYSIARPDVLAWIDRVENYYSFIIAVCTLLGSVQMLPKVKNIFTSSISRSVTLMMIPVIISGLMPTYPALTEVRFSQFMKLMLVVFLIPILIDDEKDLKHFLLTVAGSLGFVGVKFGGFGVKGGGGQLSAGYGPILSDNNFVALALAMGVPMLWFGRMLVNSKLIRTGMIGAILLSIAGIIMSNSRGGNLALGVVVLFVVLTTRQRVMALGLIAFGAVGAIYMVQDMYFNRMSTLSDVESEASAASRLYHTQAALRMWMDHPLTGVGFGGQNYAVMNYRYTTREGLSGSVAHNSWVQMLVDSGIFAFLFYVLAFLISFFFLRASAKRMRRVFPERPDLEAFPMMMLGGLLAFAVGSTFYSCQRMDLPYMLLFAAACWQRIEPKARNDQQRQAAVQSAPQPASLLAGDQTAIRGVRPMFGGGLYRH